MISCEPNSETLSNSSIIAAVDLRQSPGQAADSLNLAYKLLEAATRSLAGKAEKSEIATLLLISENLKSSAEAISKKIQQRIQ